MKGLLGKLILGEREPDWDKLRRMQHSVIIVEAEGVDSVDVSTYSRVASDFNGEAIGVSFTQTLSNGRLGNVYKGYENFEAELKTLVTVPERKYFVYKASEYRPELAYPAIDRYSPKDAPGYLGELLEWLSSQDGVTADDYGKRCAELYIAGFSVPADLAIIATTFGEDSAATVDFYKLGGNLSLLGRCLSKEEAINYLAGLATSYGITWYAFAKGQCKIEDALRYVREQATAGR